MIDITYRKNMLEKNGAENNQAMTIKSESPDGEYYDLETDNHPTQTRPQQETSNGIYAEPMWTSEEDTVILENVLYTSGKNVVTGTSADVCSVPNKVRSTRRDETEIVENELYTTSADARAVGDTAEDEDPIFVENDLYQSSLRIG